jgi:signal transduction histidine kinase
MNALSHTPPHGCITVKLRQKPDAAEITVTDSGCGIPAEHLARVFDRFYRAPSAPTNADHGVGLGLAIVKSIMTLHGGRVTVVSEVGRGTSFTLSFPHAAAPRQMTNLSS